MNLTGFDVIHETNLQPGQKYFLRTRWGAGFITASECTMEGWIVELQPDAAFNTPSQKKLRSGAVMLVPNNTGTFYEPAA